MPYFKDLSAMAEQVSLWADLRHEQGANVKPALARAMRDLKKAAKELEALAPPKGTTAAEPNALTPIRALRPKGPRKLVDAPDFKKLKSRMRGAWLARAAGCTLGVPVEAWSVSDMEQLARIGGMPFPPEDYWTIHPTPDRDCYKSNTFGDYLKQNLKEVPVDDDLTYTLLGLLILEKYGPKFTTKQVGEAWVKWLPMACTAEDITLKNLKKGIPAHKAGDIDNPYQEWIGADIRSDPWAYAAPCWPEKAAELAYRDAILSHRGNGVYGEMFFAAAISAAFALEDPIEAIRIGLTEIPKDCRLAEDVRWSLKQLPKLKDWRAARALVDKRFDGMHVVHTNNNACLTVFGLHLGQGDFTKTLGITVAMGLDNDCTGATAGSILGACKGDGPIQEHWYKPFKNKARTYLRGHEEFKNSEIVDRFLAVAQSVWNG